MYQTESVKQAPLLMSRDAHETQHHAIGRKIGFGDGWVCDSRVPAQCMARFVSSWEQNMELHRGGGESVSLGSCFIACVGLLGSVGWEVRISPEADGFIACQR